MSDTPDAKTESRLAKFKRLISPARSVQRSVFGMKALYAQSGPKRMILVQSLYKLSALGLPIVMAFLYWRDPGRSHQEKSDGSGSPIGLPGSLLPDKRVEIPPLAPEIALGALSRGYAGKGGLGGGQLYSGAQLVSRNTRSKPIPPGSLLTAKLVSGASNGPVRGEAQDDLLIAGETLIPAGSALIGVGHSSEERLFIHFSQVVFPDGSVRAISADALEDSDQIVGLKGSKVGHVATRLAAGIGLNFAGGMAEGLQESQGEMGAIVRKPTLKNALLGGAARAAISESTDLMNGLRNAQPIIEVPKGTVITLLFGGGGS